MNTNAETSTNTDTIGGSSRDREFMTVVSALRLRLIAPASESQVVVYHSIVYYAVV